jgi:phosphotriesterase family protein
LTRWLLKSLPILVVPFLLLVTASGLAASKNARADHHKSETAPQTQPVQQQEQQVPISALRGALSFVSYDQLGHEELFENIMGPGRGFSTDKEEVRCVIEMLEADYADRVLLCAEVAMKTCYKACGGWGYSHVHENIIPWLKSLGASAEQIRSQIARTRADFERFSDRSEN